ncbi:L-serine ammonia-lyase (plasmid) [Agrobacterium leguminum]|uniref:L-serine ammonia-lyase n=1 Tax=Agrobacterium leguminum TaxID=2792015 RepID=UPI00272AA9C8|nr:L-serine ammonia-lyase [Agrobacterium leguminum]WLE00985.1 L-serine ammonia-lyase [Agrobacterium leguminum]
MFLSVFDVYKIGIGPSSSHTMGPMVAAARFLDEVQSGSWPRPSNARVTRIRAILHGSLAYTGVGHATDRAVILGLCGFLPATLDLDSAEETLATVREQRRIIPQDHPGYDFDPDHDLILDRKTPLPGHANGMAFEAYDANGAMLLRRTYFSIGGGFVVSGDELKSPKDVKANTSHEVPYAFSTAAEMLRMAERSGLSISSMKLANELVYRSQQSVNAGLDELWATMNACINRGLSYAGILPGGLKVRRRAAQIYGRLREEQSQNAVGPLHANDWLSVYAMAVNEENAAGGRVVTAPTNGAAGVIPAVMRYLSDFHNGFGAEERREFLLTSAAIGGVIKHNASISGAEVGCQGEVGSASAMAAAGAAAVLGGTPAQIENAAEIALEHHLGMTCDPIAGLVQVPCIERNAFGAVKAMTAASLALRGDGTHFVHLDACIETMRQTGNDMSEKYKETSLGGLAVNVPGC